MDWSLVISILALVIAAFTALAKIADLTEDGRARLLMWTRNAASSTYRIGVWIFLIVALVNGSLGVWLFSQGVDLPSRKDILALLMFLINIATGLVGIYQALEIRAK